MALKKQKTVTILLMLFSVLSCSEENLDINNLSETIMVRHKNADMPAYIHGNASEKVFLIILHGGPGDVGLEYRANTIKDKIERNNAVVYFDQRGSGNSQGNYSEADVSIDLMAKDILALVKVLKKRYGHGSKFFLMGHSWGGTLGIATLLKNQKAFLGWIDVDGSHDPKGLYDEYRTNFRNVANEQIALGNSIEYWKSTLLLIQDVDNNYNDNDFFKMNKESFNAHKKLTEDLGLNEEESEAENDLNYNFFIATWNANKISSILVEKGLLKKISFSNRLPEITIPSLVLWGRYDMNVPLSYAQEAYDNLGAIDKQLFIFEKSKHSPMFSEPNHFADKVIDFINQHK